MHALSVCQPWAERIAKGAQREENRSWQAPSIVGHDLLLVASKRLRAFDAAHYAGEPRGVAICVVRVTAMTGNPSRYQWRFTGARRVAPFAVRGYAGLFMVPDASIVFVKPHAGDGAPRSRAAKVQRVKVGPYGLSIDDRRIAGEHFAKAEDARARAREIATHRGVMVVVERDGFEVSQVEP